MRTCRSDGQEQALHDDSLLMTLPGPSRTIIVEPIEQPKPTPVPERERPAPNPKRAPAKPQRKPEKVPG